MRATARIVVLVGIVLALMLTTGGRQERVPVNDAPPVSRAEDGVSRP